MLPVTEIAAISGVGLAAAAYVPQILHLLREHCSAGVSRPAFRAWLVASLLITSHAVAAGEAVFVPLGVVQIAATGIVLFYAKRYEFSFCTGHEPTQRQPAARSSGFTEPGEWRERATIPQLESRYTRPRGGDVSCAP